MSHEGFPKRGYPYKHPKHYDPGHKRTSEVDQNLARVVYGFPLTTTPAATTTTTTPPAAPATASGSATATVTATTTATATLTATATAMAMAMTMTTMFFRAEISFQDI